MDPRSGGTAEGRGSRPISRVLSWTAIHLGRRSPVASSSLPADSAGRLNVCLFGLAPDGVCPPRPLPARPCALTARFHPYLCPSPCGDWPRACARDPLPPRMRLSPHPRAWLSPHPAEGAVFATPSGRMDFAACASKSGPSAVCFCCTFRRLGPATRVPGL